MKRAFAILRDGLLAAAILFLLALLALRLQGTPDRPLSGHARIVDGDTLMLSGKRVRLSGIDAPELQQTCLRDGREWPCGQDARAALNRLAAAGQVVCVPSGHDRYGRVLAACRTGMVDLNREMVAAGLAVSYGGYAAEERVARAGRLGLWAGDFDRPQDWRQVHGGTGEPGASFLDGLGSVYERLMEAMANMWKDEA